MKSERIVPKFAAEADEATWWFENRDRHDQDLVRAIDAGELDVLTKFEILNPINGF